MGQHLHAIAIVVPDYDEAIDYYTRCLRFELVEDADLGGGKRFVRVAPRGSSGGSLLLAKAKDARQVEAVGNQAGGRVFLFLHTDDFAGDHAHMKAHGVDFEEAPRHEEYGTVVVFRDRYGNRWDLIERSG